MTTARKPTKPLLKVAWVATRPTAAWACQKYWQPSLMKWPAVPALPLFSTQVCTGSYRD